MKKSLCNKKASENKHMVSRFPELKSMPNRFVFYEIKGEK